MPIKECLNEPRDTLQNPGARRVRPDRAVRHRRSARAGFCGHRRRAAIRILASLGYMLGAAILTPDLWIEPLGALVKTGPAIVLMLVALMILDNR